MKILILLLICLALTGELTAQGDVQKVVETEHAFARLAAETSTKEAFLAYLADDGVLFLPDKINGKAYWNGRGPSTGLLSWAPNYADVSANGILGYTTGNWEYRPKGKDTDVTGYGEFITVWLRQPDGKYKFVVDIGIGHEKPAKYSTEWITATNKSVDQNERKSSAADAAQGFYATMAADGPAKAFKAYAVDDVRAFREEKMPMVGKKALLASFKGDKAAYSMAKRSMFFESTDLAYNLNTYTKSVDGKVLEKGNTMQIWKLIAGKWRIVLDIFKPVP